MSLYKYTPKLTLTNQNIEFKKEKELFFHLPLSSLNLLNFQKKKKNTMVKKRGIDIWVIFLVFVFSLNTNSAQNISRNNFPEGFVFGTASSAYQVCLFLPFFFFPSIHACEYESLILYLFN